MNKKKYPSVIISGLGISGLITASLLCKEKIKVECFEPIDISKFQKGTYFLKITSTTDKKTVTKKIIKQ